MPEVTVYSRENCHLCEEALDTIREVAESVPEPVDIEVLDVDEAGLADEYGERVPYVFVDGDPKFKYRVDAEKLRPLLSR
ncbi:glutaredoxin family protein [Haloarculaceae archaeon H-GB2-1]|nr:glutaredoxin family protein [Haloarculaceae archaeon H-GB1-1]MEA5385771.1 glutaredoxin family protein [Haloarculaceae archaeon H-GB11]MEA5407275.1 glutaredoxin family protein [Haloarculaceae archaeon H-GB2-1]